MVDLQDKIKSALDSSEKALFKTPKGNGGFVGSTKKKSVFD